MLHTYLFSFMQEPKATILSYLLHELELSAVTAANVYWILS